VRTTVALTVSIFSVCAVGAPQSQLLVGRLVDVSRLPPTPVERATVTVLSTGQQAVTNADGVFHFALPRAMVAGSEVQIDVKAGTLRVYQPHNGILIVPAAASKPLEVQLLPVGSPLFLGPVAIEALLARVAELPKKQPTQGSDSDPAKQLLRALQEFAKRSGFSRQAVERAVRQWANEIRVNPNASSQQQQLAHFVAVTVGITESLQIRRPSVERVFGLSPYMVLVGNFDISYRKTPFFAVVPDVVAGQWDARAEIWLFSRRRLSFGPYVRMAGLRASRSNVLQSGWTWFPGGGVQLYPLSAPVFRSQNRIIQILGPLRLFGEYNRMTYLGASNDWRPRQQIRYGAEHWRAVHVNDLASSWWTETWNALYWQSANEFSDRYRSWVLANTARLGVRDTTRRTLSRLTPYVVLETSLTPNHNYFWENVLLTGAGLRWTPALTGRSVQHMKLRRFAIYAEYLRASAYYRASPPVSFPRNEVRIGLTFSVGDWYRH
jgi:hypothetical protein